MPHPSPSSGSDGAGSSTDSGPATPQAIDEVAAVLGKIPSGLFVVTWREEELDRFMLASWVMQSGFSPPAITIAIGTSRDLLTAIARGTPFVVNLLGESQRPLLSRFGRPPAAGEDPFAGLDIQRTHCGAVAIVAAAGWLECRGIAQASSGDHTIVVAEATAGRTGSADPPIVHIRRNGLRY